MSVDFLKRWLGISRQPEVPIDAVDPSLTAMLDQYESEGIVLAHQAQFRRFQLEDSEAARAILELPLSQQLDVLRLVMHRLNATGRAGVSGYFARMQALRQLFARLLVRPLPLNEQDVSALLLSSISSGLPYRVASVLAVAERFVGGVAASGAVGEALLGVRGTVSQHAASSGSQRLLARIDALLEGGAVQGRHLPLQDAGGEPWCDVILEALSTVDEAGHNHWLAVLEHCQSATAARPNGKWLKQARACVEAVGTEAFTDIVVQALATIGTSSGAARRSTIDGPHRSHLPRSQVHRHLSRAGLVLRRV